MKITLLLILITLACTSGQRIVCYYTNWAQYRIWKFLPEDIDPKLCTHVIYAYAQVQGLGVEFVEWNDLRRGEMKGMYERVVALKKTHPHLKVLLAVAGNHNKFIPFLPVVATSASRWLFVQNTVTYLRRHHFDGVDINWIYPGTRVRPVIRKEKFVSLLQELREGMDSDTNMWNRQHLLLTVTLPAIKETIDVAYDPVSISHYTEFVSLLTFDFHGSWESRVGFNSPLYSNPQDTGYQAFLSTDWIARYYVSLGVPKNKINIGIPFYGRTFTLANVSENAVGSRAIGPGKAGWSTGFKGLLAFYEVCNITNSFGKTIDDRIQRNRYVVHGNQWIGSEDVLSVVEKTCYAKTNGYGGVMVRSLDYDDFTGNACNDGKYPLLSAISKVIKRFKYRIMQKV